MFEGNRFLPDTGNPMLKKLRGRMRLAVCDPEPLTVATEMETSLTFMSMEGSIGGGSYGAAKAEGTEEGICPCLAGARDDSSGISGVNRGLCEERAGPGDGAIREDRFEVIVASCRWIVVLGR